MNILAEWCSVRTRQPGTHLANNVDPRIWDEVVNVYVQSLKVIWWPSQGTDLISFEAVAIERSLKLWDTLETEYELEEKEDKINEGVSGDEILGTIEM